MAGAPHIRMPHAGGDLRLGAAVGVLVVELLDRDVPVQQLVPGPPHARGRPAVLEDPLADVDELLPERRPDGGLLDQAAPHGAIGMAGRPSTMDIFRAIDARTGSCLQRPIQLDCHAGRLRRREDGALDRRALVSAG